MVDFVNINTRIFFQHLSLIREMEVLLVILFPYIETTWEIGKQLSDPFTLQGLGCLQTWCSLQYLYLQELLRIFSLVISEKMGGHGTVVPAMLEMALVVGPAACHG